MGISEICCISTKERLGIVGNSGDGMPLPPDDDSWPQVSSPSVPEFCSFVAFRDLHPTRFYALEATPSRHTGRF